MRNLKYIHYRAIVIVLMLLVTCSLFNCSSDEVLAKPKFSTLTISPAQEIYHVGDVITLSTKQLTSTPSEIKAQKVWFFYPDGESQTDRILFVVNPQNTTEFVSSQITLRLAGTVQLAFYTQYDYPKYKYDGVTLYKTINIVDNKENK